MKSRRGKFTHTWMIILVSTMFFLTPTLSFAIAHDIDTHDPAPVISPLSDTPTMTMALEFDQTSEI